MTTKFVVEHFPLPDITRGFGKQARDGHDGAERFMYGFSETHLVP